MIFNYLVLIYLDFELNEYYLSYEKQGIYFLHYMNAEQVQALQFVIQ